MTEANAVTKFHETSFSIDLKCQD